jgi:transcriptional regulator with XRE-family HTH domain
MEKKIHHGKNITRFRQMLGIKQDVLASVMGDEWNQIKISRLEAKEEIEPDILDEVAKALKIPADAIKYFDEEAAISIVSNTVNNNDNASGNSLFSYYPTFNPIDKVIELYDALVKSEREKIELMQRFIDKK